LEICSIVDADVTLLETLNTEAGCAHVRRRRVCGLAWREEKTVNGECVRQRRRLEIYVQAPVEARRAAPVDEPPSVTVCLERDGSRAQRGLARRSCGARAPRLVNLDCVPEGEGLAVLHCGGVALDA
jgi:hypothetical protein